MLLEVDTPSIAVLRCTLEAYGHLAMLRTVEKKVGEGCSLVELLYSSSLHEEVLRYLDELSRMIAWRLVEPPPRETPGGEP
ncbi:MAG: hypothetical protein A2284_00530 [Deltaproteobacteria bacterium RIFOXYA12_FULL_61_11]|nr:MAG: hypothetical protein A2284_00530 [Deltaproteobacteria bacterium RIFOXYA12_FULL_61_11]